MAELKFIASIDTSQFQKGANQIIAEVQQISDEVNHEGRKIQSQFDGIGKSVGGSIGKYVAAFGGAAALKGFLGKMVEVRGEFQKTDTALRTMLGSKEKADQLLSQVREYAKISPLEFGDITRATQMMISFNIEADKVPKYIKAIGDVSMGEKDRFNSLALAFSQMSATGKLMGQDLLQMINAGFNPLAVMAEKTGKSIGELKDEMSKGAISAEQVQQAFIDATSAGGKFFNMSENAAKTINGQLSMLSDAIDTAFNELGTKSEGIISGAIKGATKMVENYETIGKVVLQLVQIYGTYKAALLVNEAILIRKTAIELAAAKGVTVLQLATDILRKKMEALNLTMLHNPYVLVASLVVTAASAFAIWGKSADSLQKTTEKLNDALADTQGKIQAEQANIDNLFGKLRKAKEGTAEYKKVKDEIISQYGQYLSGLDAEVASLRNVEAAYNAVARAAREAAIAEGKSAAIKSAQQEYGKAYADNIKQLQKRLRDAGADGKTIENILGRVQKELRDTGKIAYDTQTQIYNLINKTAKPTYSGIGYMGNELRALEKNEKNLRTVLALVDERFKAEEESRSESGKSRGRGKKDIQADIDAAQAELDGLTKQEALGKKGLALKKKIAGYKQEMKAYDAPTGKGGSRGGRGGRTTTKDTFQEEAEQRAKIIQFGRELNEQQEKAERAANDALEDARIAAIKDNGRRELAAEELAHKRRLREIREQGDEMARQQYENKKKAWELTHKKGVFEDTEEGKAGWETIMLTPEQQKLIAAQVDEEESRWERFLANRKDKERSAMNEYLRNYGTYQERRLAIAEDFDNQIDQVLYEGDKKALEAQKQAALNQLDRDFGLKTQELADLFADASDKSVKSIDNIIRKYEALVEFMKGANGDAETTVTRDDLLNLGFTEEDLKKIQTGQIKINDIIEAIKNLKSELNDKSPFKAFENELEKAFSKISKEGKVGEGIQGIGNAVNKFLPKVKEFGKEIANIFGFDDSKIQGVLDAVGGLGDAAAGVGQALSGDIVGGIMNTVGGISKIVSAVDGLFGADYSSYEKLVEQYDKLIDVWDDLLDKKREYLDESYGAETMRTEKEIIALLNKESDAWRELGKERLNAGASAGSHSIGRRIIKEMTKNDWEDITKALGTNAERMLGDRLTGLFDLSSKQLQRLKEQAPAFWARMDDDVRQYLQNIIDGAEQLEEVQQQAKDRLTRTTFDDVRSDFFSKLADMERAASDFSDDFAKMLFMAMLDTKVDELFQDRLDKWYGNFAESMKDGEISESERSALLNDYNAIVADAMQLRDTLADATGYAQSQSEGSGAYKAVSSFSQEQGDELNGRLTALQIGQERNYQSLLMAVATLQSITVIITASQSTLTEMRNLLLISNGHLEDIARYTRIASQFGDAIETIATKIKEL